MSTAPHVGLDDADPTPAPIEDGLLDRCLIQNPHLRIVLCGSDELLVKHGTRSAFSEVIRDPQRTRLIGRLVPQFARPNSLSALRNAGDLGGDDLRLALELLQDLLDRGVLVDAGTELGHVYYDTVLGANGAAGRLAEKVVGLVGCGSLGAAIADAVAHGRPRGFRLLDPRPATSPGTTQATALAKRLETRVGSVETVEADDVVDEGAIADVVEQADFVLVALGSYSPALLHAVNEQAVKRSRPWMSSYFDGSEAIVGPTYVVGETPCYHEFETQAQACLKYQGEYLAYKEMQRESATDGDSLLPEPYVMVAAGWTAASALRFLLQGRTFTAGRAMRIGFDSLSIDLIDVFKLPRCPACSGERPAYRNLFL